MLKHVQCTVGRFEVSPAFSGAPGNSAAESALAQPGKSEQSTYADHLQYSKNDTRHSQRRQTSPSASAASCTLNGSEVMNG